MTPAPTPSARFDLQDRAFPAHVIAAAQSICADRSQAIALIDDAGEEMTYATLLQRSARLANELAAATAGAANSEERPRFAFLVDATPAWVVTLWAIWRAGAVAVPLSPKHPQAEIEYVLSHSRPKAVVLGDNYAVQFAQQQPTAPRALVIDGRGLTANESLLPSPAEAARELDAFAPDHDALMLYTSGTTSRPKGVVTTHRNLVSQLRILTTTWGIEARDHSLLTLPLHHVHGIVNVVLSTLYKGGTVTMLKKFDAEDVTKRLTAADSSLTIFMAVPTIYRRLLAIADDKEGRRAAYRAAGDRMRLMVSGSAALPAPDFDAWEALTGHRLLERYGMTEIGMALGNPLEGERVRATVGFPLPHVAVRLATESANPAERTVIEGDGEGEIEIAGPSVFRGYFEDHQATLAATTADGWFRTGDRARRENGRYAILGRLSVDILKSGGEKISALEIEATLLEHPLVAAVAVIGVPHPDWGDEVVAVIESQDTEVDVESIRSFAKERLSAFKVPRRVVVGPLPRNALGKVQKKVLLEQVVAKRTE